MLSIMEVQTGEEWTLSEAARLLEEPQHRLIYLCEEEVVVPDFSQARGRGSRRRLSKLDPYRTCIESRLPRFDLPATILVRDSVP